MNFWKYLPHQHKWRHPYCGWWGGEDKSVRICLRCKLRQTRYINAESYIGHWEFKTKEKFEEWR